MVLFIPEDCRLGGGCRETHSLIPTQNKTRFDRECIKRDIRILCSLKAFFVPWDKLSLRVFWSVLCRLCLAQTGLKQGPLSPWFQASPNWHSMSFLKVNPGKHAASANRGQGPEST